VSRDNRSRAKRPLNEKLGVFVERTPAEVWAFVSDITQMSAWRPRLQDMRWLDEPARVGSRFEGASTFALWRKVRLVCRITQWEPPTHFRYEVIEGPIRADALWGVCPESDGSWFFGAGDIVGKSLPSRVLRPLAAPLFARETRSELRRLKEILAGGR